MSCTTQATQVALVATFFEHMHQRDLRGQRGRQRGHQGQPLDGLGVAVLVQAFEAYGVEHLHGALLILQARLFPSAGASRQGDGRHTGCHDGDSAATEGS